MKVFSINGTIKDEAAAVIPVTDHGFLYGDGVFEGLRFYGKRILMCTAHLERLEASAKAIDLTIPITRDSMIAQLNSVVTHSDLDDGYIRLVVTRGAGPLGIDPRHCSTANIVMIADQLSMVSPEVRAKGARLVIASTRRLAGDQFDSRIKSLNYLNQIMARMEANVAEADEAIVLNNAGFVAEGTADNVFIARKGTLLTPPATDGALEGITRQIIMDIGKAMGFEVKEHSLTTYDLFNADECFLTGTGAELIPVREIAGRQIAASPGPIFSQIEKGFFEALQKDDLFF